MRYWLSLLVVCFGIFPDLRAQKPAQVLSWLNTIASDQTNFSYEIPFEYRNNAIVIPVTIGNKTYDYIFDTGGFNNLTDEMQAGNGFPVLTTQTVGSSNKLKKQVNIVKVDTVAIGGLTMKDVAMLQMDYSDVPGINCTINGGLIGASIIKKYIWKIDYTNKKIIVTDRKTILPSSTGTIKVPVTFDQRLMPYISLAVNGTEEKVLFDLGSNTLFSMTQKTALKYTNEKNSIAIIGAGTEGGNGIVKQDVFFFKANNISIGEAQYINKPVVYAKLNNISLIGNPVIKDYIITLNFPGNEMYWEPIPVSNQKDGWKSFGFTLGYQEGKVRVATLYAGYAADKAGLRVGDEVLAIDGQPLPCNAVCDCLRTLPALLAAKDSITLTIQSNNETKDMTFAKEKVF
jgi:hypothetical protein